MKIALFIGSYARIKVYLHWTFLLFLVWTTVSEARNGWENAFWSLLFILGVFMSVTLHEFGHALTAQRFGIQTHDVTLYPIGGVASLEQIPENPKEELAVALAGPLVNVAIALLLAPFIDWSEMFSGMPVMKGFNAHTLLPALFYVNVILPLFNMIPAFPMDGGRVLRALLAFKLPREKATRIAATLGQFIAVVLVFYGFTSNPFLIVIGIFVFFGAESEARFTEGQVLLRGLKVQDAMMLQYPKLNVTDTVGDAARALLNTNYKRFFITDNQKVVGIVDEADILKAIAERGEMHPLSKVMHNMVLTLQADMPLSEGVMALKENTGFIPVISGENVMGVIDIEHIIELLAIRKARRKVNW